MTEDVLQAVKAEASIAMAALFLLVSQWLQLVQGWSPLRSGLALLPAAVTGVLAGPFAPAVAARTGARAVLVGAETSDDE